MLLNVVNLLLLTLYTICIEVVYIILFAVLRIQYNNK